MYFEKFPKTFYTLDNRLTVQLVTNITLRAKISEELKNNYSFYDLYDIRDGDTPELIAFEFYGDSNLHWIILHANDLLDPRFEWVLSTTDLYDYVSAKYDRVNGVHHYENLNGKEINGNLNIVVNSTSAFSVGDAILSNADSSIGFITSVVSPTTIVVTTTKGGFTTGEQVLLASNTNIKANITSTTILTGTPVTNLKYEELLNESKRRIKIVKPQFIEKIIRQFESKMSRVNG